MDTFRINEKDNVLVDLSTGHKIAAREIKKGEDVIKYGFPIGKASEDIPAGARVHSHNLKSALGGPEDYVYVPAKAWEKKEEPFDIFAYVRGNGDVGIRNDVWIVPTVGCVNPAVRRIAALTGAVGLTHPYGCSQLGDDHETTKKVLRGLVLHPNAGGVLVLGLGCENNRLEDFRAFLGEVDPARVRFLNAQDCGDEVSEGVRLVRELQALSAKDERVRVSVSRLRVGLKCGGSDGFSGIVANPLVGRVTDRLCAMGAAAVLTEVPEMFGAERTLFERCVSEEVFHKSADLVNRFKQYYLDHGQPVSENPSPGNRDGGITTLEEKSLGCVQKGGAAPVTDVLTYGETVKMAGLTLLDGPGNDAVSLTNLTAAGCHLVLFTTGRGTPLGGAVPTVKISSNTPLALKKPRWIDFDAAALPREAGEEALLDLIRRVANGEPTNNERFDNREIAIFKDGVTL